MGGGWRSSAVKKGANIFLVFHWFALLHNWKGDMEACGSESSASALSLSMDQAAVLISLMQYTTLGSRKGHLVRRG